MVSALLPHMSVPVVTALTGHPQVGRLLDAGYRRHLFVTRSDAGEPVYRYHALFREFLLGQLRAEVSPDELAGLRRRAAELLEADGAVESAFELYRDAGDWPNAVRMTLAHAPAMIAEGRVPPLAALPAAEREREPWLAYWEGLVRMDIEPLTALASLERAHQGFVARGDIAGQIQAAEAAIGSRHLAWEDWRPILRWIDVLEQLLADKPAFGSPEAEARALSALAIGLAYCRPGHPMLAACLERLEPLLDSVADKNVRVTAATRLLDALIKTGDHGAAQRVADRLRPALEDPEVRPLAGAWGRIWLGVRRLWQGRFDDYAALSTTRSGSRRSRASASSCRDHPDRPVLPVHRTRGARRAARGHRPARCDPRSRPQAGTRVAALVRELSRRAPRRLARGRAAGAGRRRALARDRLRTGRVHLPHGVAGRAGRDRTARECQAVLERMQALVAGCGAGSCGSTSRSGKRTSCCRRATTPFASRSRGRSSSGGARTTSTSCCGGRR